MGLLRGQINQHHRYLLYAQLPGSQQTLVTADDGVVLSSGDDWVDQPELPDAPGKRLQFFIADPSGVGRIGTQVTDGQVRYLQSL